MPYGFSVYLVGKEQADSLADSKRQGKDGEPSGMKSAGLETSVHSSEPALYVLPQADI